MWLECQEGGNLIFGTVIQSGAGTVCAKSPEFQRGRLQLGRYAASWQVPRLGGIVVLLGLLVCRDNAKP